MFIIYTNNGILFSGVHKARFKRRLNRFVAVVIYNQQELTCHLPNPGRMVEILIENETTVFIQLSTNPKRKTKATIVAAVVEDEIVNLDTQLFRPLLASGIEHKALELFNDWQITKPEVKVGDHRFDFQLTIGSVPWIFEVKSTTLVNDDVACFPDAVSKRATKHVLALRNLSTQGEKCGIIFLVYRKATSFSPCWHIDPEFASELAKSNELVILPILVEGQQIDDETLSYQFVGPLKYMPRSGH